MSLVDGIPGIQLKMDLGIIDDGERRQWFEEKMRDARERDNCGRRGYLQAYQNS